ncbi:MAG: hypothetical protein NZ524_10770 [Thiobacillaceae bacterium]|nr:hypothetical protein [Thiobacillaceae bacterium]MCX7672987.1 hypothetical protein [Thiobacillaceae bacterium]MDW8323450.1 hypothetical protein [Burkholderiales bacterium]
MDPRDVPQGEQHSAAERAPVFPRRILPAELQRPFRVPVALLSAVRSAQDLPTRLFLGDLVPERFRLEKRGWSAEWLDADGHRVRLRHAGGLSGLELAYRGSEVVSLTSAERFDELATSVRDIHPGAWLDILRRHLEGRYNLRVLLPREDDAVVADFPDGHRLTLAAPVPADQLPQLLALHERLQADTTLRSPVQAYVRLAYSVVNYLEGRNPAMLAHPAGVVLHHVNALGTPAAEAPVREVDADGVVAWTLRRQHYLYLAHLYLRDAARFTERLAAAGFIGAQGAGEGYPAAAEFGALLMPYGYERVARNLYWFDAQRRRRVVYPLLAEPEDAQAAGGRGGDPLQRALARQAQRQSEQFKADTLRAFAEGLHGQGQG